MLSRGSSSFSVWVHLRGLELTKDWFEYQIREKWIHIWSRLISLFRDVQSVRCMAISFTYHLQSYMHRLHRGHIQYGALISSGRFHQSLLVDMNSSWSPLITSPSGWRQLRMLYRHWPRFLVSLGHTSFADMESLMS